MADIRDLRIGDRVLDKRTCFPFVVVGLLQDCVQAIPEVDDYEGDIWEFDPECLFLCDKQSKALKWNSDTSDCLEAVMMIHKYLSISYVIKNVNEGFELSEQYISSHSHGLFYVGTYKTLSEAKCAAQENLGQELSGILFRIR